MAVSYKHSGDFSGHIKCAKCFGQLRHSVSRVGMCSLEFGCEDINCKSCDDGKAYFGSIRRGNF